MNEDKWISEKAKEEDGADVSAGAMTPDAPLSDEQIDKYEAAILNGQLMHGAPQIVYDLVQSHRALASERDELKYKMQVMADMVGEENWSLRNQLADAQARVTYLEGQVAGYDRWLSGGVYYTTEEYEREIAVPKRELEQQHATLTARAMEAATKLVCMYCNDPTWQPPHRTGSGVLAHCSPITGTVFPCTASAIHEHLAKQELATGGETGGIHDGTS